MIIDRARRYRIRVSTEQTDLRTPQAIANAYYSGSRETAIHSAIADVTEFSSLRPDFRVYFLIEEWDVSSDSYRSIKSGEGIGGSYYPRENF